MTDLYEVLGELGGCPFGTSDDRRVPKASHGYAHARAALPSFGRHVATRQWFHGFTDNLPTRTKG
jgi:hypothetical protein